MSGRDWNPAIFINHRYIQIKKNEQYRSPLMVEYPVEDAMPNRVKGLLLFQP